MKIRRIHVVILLCTLCLLAVVFRRTVWRYANGAILMVKGKATVAERVAEYGSAVQGRLVADFERLGADWPGAKMTLIGIKDQNLLEVWIAGDDGDTQLLKTYPILKTSGRLGSKLAEGDRQVPEGLYDIESLNPNSRFHLSLRLNYPNAFDRQTAQADGRTDPGSDIMIHGGRVSIGCLAMGDPAAEDLFVLAAEVGLDNIEVILTPTDFRNPAAAVDTSNMPDWVNRLYDQIRTELNQYHSVKHSK